MSENHLLGTTDPNNSKYAWRKRPRKFSSKSRKGCKTCKARRIKCDQARPYCHKCVSTGRACEGYSENPCAAADDKITPTICDSNAQSQPSPQVLASYAIADLTWEGQSHSEEPPHTSGSTFPLSPRCPLILYPNTSEEYLLLNFFSFKTLPQLSGHRQSIPWAQTVIFFANTAKCVHHAAVALGSLHQDYFSELSGQRTRRHVQNENPNLFALYHYNLAINHLLSSSSCSGDTIRDKAVTLLVCYLFTCFDHLAGNCTRASKHLQSGTALLNETRASIGDFTGMTQSSSDQELIEQITEQFRYLDMQESTFLLGWSPHNQPEVCMDEEASDQVSFGPTDIRLNSLAHAANLLDDLILKIMGLRRWESIFRRFRQTGVSDTSPIYTATLRGFLNWQGEVADELEAWSDGFTMLLRSISDHLCASDQYLVDMLRFHYIVASTLHFMSLGTTEMMYDTVLTEFKTAVSLASSLANNCVETPEGRASDTLKMEPRFTLEFGIIPALYLVGMKCRNPSLRREILYILRRNPRREGMWDSISTARIIERVMQMEEGQDSAGFELGVKTMADISHDRRITRAHWGPVNGLFGTLGSQIEVVYDFCSSAKRQPVRETIIL